MLPLTFSSNFLMQPRPTFPVAVLPTVGYNVHILLILATFTMRARSKNRVEKLEKVCRLTIKGVWSVWMRHVPAKVVSTSKMNKMF